MARFLLLTFSMLIFTAQLQPTQAQTTPDVPDALEVLVERGAQVRYLGKKHGMDGWITIFQGQEQYYYVTPDGQGFVLGLLFSKDGSMETIKQVQSLQQQSGDVLDFLADDKKTESLDQAIAETNEAFEYKSPAERMFADVENSNYLAFGDKDAPVIYSFMDPQCPHCHSFMKDLRNGYLDEGRVQMRMIPVGFREETLAQSALLLASPDAQDRWYKHLDGDTTALPANNKTNTRGIEKNLVLMQNWKFDATPLTIYRDKAGKIKIVRGRATDMAQILADLPS